jgi:Rrf2 family protein
MLRLSKKADYALIAMKHLAQRADGASASAREIAEAYDIPLELLAKVLQRLVRARLLVSVQGTRGGYRLGRPAAAIPVADVIQSVDGPVAVTACSTDDHNCDQYSKCSIRDPLWKIRSRIIDALNMVSVAELATDDPPAEAPRTVSRMTLVMPGD